MTAIRRSCPVIAIEVEPFGFGVDVRVIPPPVGVGHDREFRSAGEARGYAALLAKATGWQVRDRVGADPDVPRRA